MQATTRNERASAIYKSWMKAYIERLDIREPLYFFRNL
jgi:hypothetical protein